MKTRGREIAEQFVEDTKALRHLLDVEALRADLALAIDDALKAAMQRGFKTGFEHAVAGGEEASKRSIVPKALLPLVMYFAKEEDRREMIDAVQLAKPGMCEFKVPERGK